MSGAWSKLGSGSGRGRQGAWLRLEKGPTCQATWLPLVLLLLLLPVVPVPRATAAPIPDANAKSQDSLESMLQVPPQELPPHREAGSLAGEQHPFQPAPESPFLEPNLFSFTRLISSC
ncbi:uncharacterized protein LOC144614756 [Panthera onca]